MEKAKSVLTVKAKELGYYGLKRRREGEIFKVFPNHFSDKWMTLLQGELPKSIRLSEAKIEGDKPKAQQEPKAQEESGELVEIDGVIVEKSSQPQSSDLDDSSGDQDVL